MKKLFAVCCAIISMSLSAQVGKQFPIMLGTTLSGQKVTIPIRNTKYTVLAIAFNKSAEDDLKKWLNPLYYTFIQKSDVKGKTIDVSETYDVNFYFVPLIAGMKKIAEDFKSGTDKGFWPYILDTEKTDIKDTQKQLGIKDNSIPYFYVLDKDNKILEVVSGSFTDEKMDKLEDVIE